MGVGIHSDATNMTGLRRKSGREREYAKAGWALNKPGIARFPQIGDSG